MRAERTCPTCGKGFRPWVSTQRHCSYACRPKAERTSRTERACGVCGKRYLPRNASQRFCSPACGRSNRSEHAWEEATCLNCTQPFRRRTAPSQRSARTFCSRLCSQNYTAGENHPLYREGGRADKFGSRWGPISESIRERDGRKCRRCGKPESDNGKRLHIDHIIPRRRFESMDEANEPSNLVSLCSSCHAIKTSGPERAYLRGDTLPLLAWRESLALPSAAERPDG